MSAGGGQLTDDFTLGVEEEYQLVDLVTGDLRQTNQGVLAEARATLGDQVQPELLRSQVEVATAVCRDLGEVDRELRRLRRRVSEAANEMGCRLGAAGSHPFARWEGQEVTPKDRYRTLAREFQQVARETMIFGCHVHIGIAEPDRRIEVMNAMRRWLPAVLACSANSPFSAGVDSGYASYRTVLFRRWPMTGMPQYFRDWDDFQCVVAALVDAGAVEDATNLYWDLRPSVRFPTLEIRIADVCLTVDDAVTVAGLIQGIAFHVAGSAGPGRPVAPVAPVAAGPGDRPELLEAAVWRAARYGLGGELLDLDARRLLPAPEMVTDLVDRLRPSLEALGTWTRISEGVNSLISKGNGADRQRRAYALRRDFADVVDLIGKETAAGL